MHKKQKIILVLILLFNLSFAQGELNKSSAFSPMLKSAILPGWGEYGLNESSRGNFFITTELLGIALTTFSFIRSNSIASTYEGFAAEHAQVNIDGKDHQFWVDIGNYNSRIDHNEEQLRFRDKDDLYPIEAKWNWNWDTQENRQEFEDLRVSSDRMKLVGKFFIGGIVLNHIVSVIDVYYLKNISLEDKFELKSQYNPENHALVYSLQFNL